MVKLLLRELHLLTRVYVARETFLGTNGGGLMYVPFAGCGTLV